MSSTIPSFRTRLVGRDADLEALRDALEAGGRLITLTGPGGVGKTRLASELAMRNRPAVFFDLADAKTPTGRFPWVDNALPSPTPP